MSMSNYVPTTEEVREVYCTPLTMSAAIDEDAHWAVAGEFDRWIASVKAAAWKEGADAAIAGFDLPDLAQLHNPYSAKGAGDEV